MMKLNVNGFFAISIENNLDVAFSSSTNSITGSSLVVAPASSINVMKLISVSGVRFIPCVRVCDGVSVWAALQSAAVSMVFPVPPGPETSRFSL